MSDGSRHTCCQSSCRLAFGLARTCLQLWVERAGDGGDAKAEHQREVTVLRAALVCHALHSLAVSRISGKMRMACQSQGRHNAAITPEPKMIGLPQRSALFLLFGKNKAFRIPLLQKAGNKC